MPGVADIAGIVVCCVSLLLGTLALALPSWMVNSDITVEAGLWKVCIEKECVLYSDVGHIPIEGAINAMKALLFLAIFTLVGTVVCAVLKIVLKKDVLQLLASVLAFAAGLFFMIGFAVFAGEIITSENTYGAASALDIVAWLLAWVAGGLFMASKFFSNKSS